MNITKFPVLIALILTMTLLLAACTESNEPSASPEQPSSAPTNGPATPSPTDSEPTDGQAGGQSDDPAGEQPSGSVRPPTESFDLRTAEGFQPHTAALQQGEGYSLYVFEMFSFNAEQGRLYLSRNSEYKVDIELLPANYDIAQLKAAGEEELIGSDKVSDYSGELVEHPLGYAELYLQASQGNGISDYIVWKSVDGDAFLFRLHNPKSEEAADFASAVMVSMSTVQSDSN